MDYQESFVGSPAFDLNHLLYSSANSEIQRAGFEELVQLYTDELRDALRQFKYDGPLPDLARVQSEMATKRDHGKQLICIQNAEHNKANLGLGLIF